MYCTLENRLLRQMTNVILVYLMFVLQLFGRVDWIGHTSPSGYPTNDSSGANHNDTEVMGHSFENVSY